MYCATKENPHRAIRTLAIHQGKGGWYFTVTQGEVLLTSSKEIEDRAETVVRGMAYLDFLNEEDYKITRQQKGKSNGL